MKIAPHQLAPYLQQGLSSIYFIFGDNPYQKTEMIEAIRAKALAEGITERERFDVSAGFNWERWYHNTQELSLFAIDSEKRLMECHLNTELNTTKTIGLTGAKALHDFMQSRPADIVLLITAPKLDAAALRSQWFKTVDSQGITLYCQSNAQFSVFDLVNAVFSGSLERTKTIFAYLKHEVDAMLVLWALIRKIRSIQSPSTLDASHLLRRAQAIEAIIKGSTPGNAWDALYLFCLSLLGVKTLDV